MAESTDKLWTYWNIIIMATGSLYCLIFVMIIIYNYLNATNTSRIKIIFVLTAILHILGWLIHFISSMTTYINTKSNIHDIHDIANIIICIMLIFHPFLFYIHTTIRLFHSFKDSVHKLNVCQLSLIISFGSVGVISRFIGQTSWILYIIGEPPIVDIESGKWLNCLWTFIAFDVATRLIMVYLFVTKLFLVILRHSVVNHTPSLGDQIPSDSNHNTNDNANISIKTTVVLNRRQMQVLGVIHKIVLLGVVSALPLTVARIVFVIDFIVNMGIFTHQNWITFNMLQGIAVFIELLAIVLSFSFNRKCYYFCCKYCDSGCGKICEKETKRRIEQKLSMNIGNSNNDDEGLELT